MRHPNCIQLFCLWNLRNKSSNILTKLYYYCWDWSGAKECTTSRFRKMLKNEFKLFLVTFYCLLSKTGVDTAGSEPEVEVWNINYTCTSYVEPRRRTHDDLHGKIKLQMRPLASSPHATRQGEAPPRAGYLGNCKSLLRDVSRIYQILVNRNRQ